MGLVGVGAVLAVLLLMPGGGSLAGPVHDAFFTALGIGAWLVAAGLVVTGARLLQGHEWRGGAVAAMDPPSPCSPCSASSVWSPPAAPAWFGNKIGRGSVTASAAPPLES